MATAFTVGDIYTQLCVVLLEDTGLTLGIFTETEFLALFPVVLLDFIEKTGLVKEIFTQQVNFNEPQYLNPPDVTGIDQCFVGGVYLDHATLAELDDWQYDWRRLLDTPQYWHQDGLAVNVVELAPNPNYTGTAITLDDPDDPEAQPPFGEYGVFSPSAGNLTMIGTKALLTETFTTDSVIPVVPDSFCPYLLYGVLARVWSTDGENKDALRANYAQSRFTEGVNLGAAIGGMMSER